MQSNSQYSTSYNYIEHYRLVLDNMEYIKQTMFEEALHINAKESCSKSMTTKIKKLLAQQLRSNILKQSEYDLICAIFGMGGTNSSEYFTPNNLKMFHDIYLELSRKCRGCTKSEMGYGLDTYKLADIIRELNFTRNRLGVNAEAAIRIIVRICLIGNVVSAVCMYISDGDRSPKEIGETSHKMIKAVERLDKNNKLKYLTHSNKELISKLLFPVATVQTSIPNKRKVNFIEVTFSDAQDGLNRVIIGTQLADMVNKKGLYYAKYLHNYYLEHYKIMAEQIGHNTDSVVISSDFKYDAHIVIGAEYIPVYNARGNGFTKKFTEYLATGGPCQVVYNTRSFSKPYKDYFETYIAIIHTLRYLIDNLAKKAETAKIVDKAIASSTPMRSIPRTIGGIQEQGIHNSESAREAREDIVKTRVNVGRLLKEYRGILRRSGIQFTGLHLNTCDLVNLKADSVGNLERIVSIYKELQQICNNKLLLAEFAMNDGRTPRLSISTKDLISKALMSPFYSEVCMQCAQRDGGMFYKVVKDMETFDLNTFKMDGRLIQDLHEMQEAMKFKKSNKSVNIDYPKICFIANRDGSPYVYSINEMYNCEIAWVSSFI